MKQYKLTDEDYLNINTALDSIVQKIQDNISDLKTDIIEPSFVIENDNGSIINVSTKLRINNIKNYIYITLGNITVTYNDGKSKNIENVYINTNRLNIDYAEE